MLTRDRIDIFMVGEFDDYQVLQALHRFPLEGRQVDLQFSYSQPYVNVVKEKIEPRQSSQSILQLGYQFSCQYGDKDYFALIVFNAMFGEFATLLYLQRFEKRKDWLIQLVVNLMSLQVY